MPKVKRPGHVPILQMLITTAVPFSLHDSHYSYARRSNYAENLYVIMRVLELETLAVIERKKSFEQFTKEFAEEHDISERRKDARKTLDLEEDCMDLGVIDSRYKSMAKNLHPDMPTGSEAAFKKLNNAHKLLKRELK